MCSRLNAELETVPGADDVQPGLVERKALAFAALLDHFRDARNDFALANGTTLMRAAIVIGVDLAPSAEDSDRRVANVNNEASALLQFASGAGVDSGWGFLHLYRVFSY